MSEETLEDLLETLLVRYRKEGLTPEESIRRVISVLYSAAGQAADDPGSAMTAEQKKQMMRALDERFSRIEDDGVES